jgi:hypothetical protein
LIKKITSFFPQEQMELFLLCRAEIAELFHWNYSSLE